MITIDVSNPPAPECECEHPEFPSVEPGRVTAVLRRLIAKALQEKEIEPQEAVNVLRFIDSADCV